jgi:hypothetical protein
MVLEIFWILSIFWAFLNFPGKNYLAWFLDFESFLDFKNFLGFLGFPGKNYSI